MALLVNAVLTENVNEVIRTETDEDRLKFKIEELKQVCFEEVKANPNDYDPRDVKALEADSETGIMLFLESNDWKVEPALAAIKRHCSYRRENGVLDLKVTDIPVEVHQTGLFIAKGFDKAGHPLFFIRLSVSPGPKEMHQLIIKQFLLACETVRNMVLEKNKKLAIIFDCRQAQVDIGLLREILDIYTQKYPPAAEYIAFLDMNFGFKMILQIIKYFFPKYLWKKMIFIDQETLKTMVDQDNLPYYLDGKIEPLSKSEISECPNLADYAKANNIKDKVYEKMKSHLDKQLSNDS